MTAASRFPWNPDCQEVHAIHEPNPSVPDEPDEQPHCEVCGHDVDIVFVHLFEVAPDMEWVNEVDPRETWHCDGEFAEHWPKNASDPDSECGACGASGGTYRYENLDDLPSHPDSAPFYSGYEAGEA